MRGSCRDESIREYDIDGIHIGRAFREVGGILAGTHQRYVLTEEERMGSMFHDAESQVEAAAGM
ncbi:MAG: hypothetical protein CMJ50_09105 [Planctomycetaceae bacterium]|nr:hypothetical protein [Planctomycetaceae bacterium]